MRTRIIIIVIILNYTNQNGVGIFTYGMIILYLMYNCCPLQMMITIRVIVQYKPKEMRSNNIPV